ncbi:MAG: HI0074 family nucleotidyltransferase substrate-binding subunit [Burkholderiales bacterium]
MSNNDDIRWRQRLENYEKAVAELREACGQKEYNKLERAGLIQLFELTFELGWKTLQDILAYEGQAVGGARTALREVHRLELISDIDGWIAMLEVRNRLTHAYDEKAVLATVNVILENYQFLLERLMRDLRAWRERE